MLFEIALLGSAVISSAMLTGWTRHYALRNRLIDHPNYRSSHSIPTPRGGGLAIVAIFVVALSFLTFTGRLDLNAFMALAGGGALVAAIGCRDDRCSLPAKVRLAGHFGAAIWSVLWIGSIARLDLGFATWDWGWLGHLVSIVGIVWLLNLYNFMDGIDGLAASQAVLAAGAGALLLLGAGAGDLALTAFTLAAASAGFLVWNLPPARIFMGDVGSGFLGYVFATLAVLSANRADFSPWIWLLLLSVFIVDASVTLLRRALRGERIHQSHRSHAYQHATDILGSHLRVVIRIVALNLLVLFPLALITWKWPNVALLTTGIAVLLLILLALKLNAGIATDRKGDRPYAARHQSETSVTASQR